MRYLKFCIPIFLLFFLASSADASAPRPAPEPGVLLLLGAGLVAIALGVQEKKEEILIRALGKKMQDPDRILHFPSLLIEPLAYLL
jgi:hypothetical protein